VPDGQIGSSSPERDRTVRIFAEERRCLDLPRRRPRAGGFELLTHSARHLVVGVVPQSGRSVERVAHGWELRARAGPGDRLRT
jgi:hypothetical protein